MGWPKRLRDLLLWMLAILVIAPSARPADCSATSTGLIPLTELGSGLYRGMRGGLYPDGVNGRTSGHEAAGLQLAAEVLPRNGDGLVDLESGKIVLLSIGMSNTTQEYSAFQQLADQDPSTDPRLVLVDGAQGGQSAQRIVTDGERYWNTIEERLQQAGVTSDQVQVAWMKQANPNPPGDFPEDARQLQADLAVLARTLRSRFPQLRLLYLSSRIYAGYASTRLHPEPFAYQSAFAVKWLIEEQIEGKPELSYATAQAPWMAWGPYLWADGLQAREDGLTWACSDLGDDGTHPSASGQEKVGTLLLDFFKSDTTTRGWFAKSAEQEATPRAAGLVNAASLESSVAPGSIVSLFGSDLAPGEAFAQSLPLPRNLAGVRVAINGELVPLYFVAPGQINLLVPQTATSGTITVLYEGASSTPLPLALIPMAPAVFTLSDDELPPAAAVHLNGLAVGPDHPAMEGEAIMLFGTGLGRMDPLTLKPTLLPSVRIGGVPAEVLFAGQTSGSPGLDQVNFTIPEGARSGPAVLLELYVGDQTAPAVGLAVATP